MQSFTRFSILALVLAGLFGQAFAVDLVSNAAVTVVEGIDITETTPLNFGTIVARDGNLVIAPAGTYTDDDALVYDNTAIAAANFSIQASENANLTASAADVAAADGLALTNFTFRWDGSTGGANYNFAGGNTTGTLQVGGTLEVNSANATFPVGAGAQSLPWTLAVVFQ